MKRLFHVLIALAAIAAFAAVNEMDYQDEIKARSVMTRDGLTVYVR